MRVAAARATALLLVALPLCAGIVAAQDKKDGKKDPPPSDDAIAAQLLKDKEAFVAAAEKAKGDMLKSFDKLYESVKNNKTLKIDVQLAMLEKIEEEKKAFDEEGLPPTLTGMKAAFDNYRAALKKGEAACRAAFEKAAKAYRDKGDVKEAGVVLDEMREFLAGTASVTAEPMTIRCGNSNLVLGLQGGKTEEGTRVVTAEYVKGDQTQLWRKIPAEDGYVYVENVKTGLVMTAKGKDEGVHLTVSKKNPDSEFQLWKLTPVPQFKDTVKIVPKPSGRPLGIWGESKEPGAELVIWTDGNKNHRYFGFFPPK